MLGICGGMAEQIRYARYGTVGLTADEDAQ